MEYNDGYIHIKYPMGNKTGKLWEIYAYENACGNMVYFFFW